MKNNMYSVVLSDVSKSYILHHQKPTLFEGISKKSEKFWALKNINLKVKKGEKLGIVGPNGSGKTTLLKVIAGITTPSSGSVDVCGRVVSLIDLNAGFHADLTGEENMYLNGLLIGMERREIKARFDSIVKFSGIKKFIDVPVYTYSSGMKLRLGFSIAINSSPDVMILDENILAGDGEFQEQILKVTKQMKKVTMLMCSHSSDLLARHCESFLTVNKGSAKRLK